MKPTGKYQKDIPSITQLYFHISIGSDVTEYQKGETCLNSTDTILLISGHNPTSC